MQQVDHKTIIASLTAAQRTSLLQRSDAAGLKHFAAYLAAMALCTLLIVQQAPLQPLVVLMQGLFIVFLFTLLHETVHRTPFASESLNLWVGRFCGFLVFLGPEWFRYFHFAHHRYTHEPGRDPELASAKPETALQYLTYISGIPETFQRIRTLFRNAIYANRDAYVPIKGKTKVMKEARIQLALYGALIAASIALESTFLVWVWLVPFLVGGPFLRGYLLAEHARCPHVASMLENTRTTFTTPLVRFLAWNMPYHVEHHAYPAVPFYKLPEFHEVIRGEISYLQDGYVRFNRTYLKDGMSGKLTAENQSRD
ncbi:MAG: fatty acid desaturase [Rhizobiaceae bacterium]|nr:fatty acid desaturase [Rhizobiaceae bacterium]